MGDFGVASLFALQFFFHALDCAPVEGLEAQCGLGAEVAVAALFALQAHFFAAGFPLGEKGVAILPVTFRKLYDDDIMEEDPMQAWRNDMRNATPGHDKALLQVERCARGQGVCAARAARDTYPLSLPPRAASSRGSTRRTKRARRRRRRRSSRASQRPTTARA
jgi:hypothetical protein